MRMLIFTFPRMQPLRLVPALAAALLLMPSVAAQDTRGHSSIAQANLQITVNIVRAAGHHDRDKEMNSNHERDAILYNLNPRYEQFSVTEEERPMPTDSNNNAIGQQQIRTTTVVLK
jgi:hypothetical protein